jgi:hypothetical protein
MPLPRLVPNDLVSGEELLGRPDLEPCELVEGRVVSLSPTNLEHGRLELRVGSAPLEASQEGPTPIDGRLTGALAFLQT